MRGGGGGEKTQAVITNKVHDVFYSGGLCQGWLHEIETQYTTPAFKLFENLQF